MESLANYCSKSWHQLPFLIHCCDFVVSFVTGIDILEKTPKWFKNMELLYLGNNMFKSCCLLIKYLKLIVNFC